MCHINLHCYLILPSDCHDETENIDIQIKQILREVKRPRHNYRYTVMKKAMLFISYLSCLSIEYLKKNHTTSSSSTRSSASKTLLYANKTPCGGLLSDEKSYLDLVFKDVPVFGHSVESIIDILPLFRVRGSFIQYLYTALQTVIISSLLASQLIIQYLLQYNLYSWVCCIS